MPGLGTLFGEAGEVAEQLFIWGVLQEIIQAAAQPFLNEIMYLFNTRYPTARLSPEIAAQLVVRGVKTVLTATLEARASGITSTRFESLLHLAAEPPGLETVLQMYRRGIIEWGEIGPTKPTVANAIATSRTYTYWATAIRQMNVVPIPAAEMVDALVEGQTTAGTRTAAETVTSGAGGASITPNATTFYECMAANGYTPDQADLMYHTRGNPPAPMQLVNLYRRGLIPWTGKGQTKTTVQQGIYEGATKDKWEPVFKGLVREIPSLYYITELLSEGDISATLAAELLADSGYTSTIVAGISGVSTSSQQATTKHLTQSVITSLYAEKGMTRAQAKTLLINLGYSTASATVLLDSEDLKRTTSILTAATTKVGTQYVDHKITETQAKSQLAALGMTTAQITQVIGTWTLERTDNTKLLTAAEIASAFEYTLFDQATAMRELENIGYTARDAYIVLCDKVHGVLPTKPATLTVAPTTGT